MANSVDPDETACYEASHLDLHCLQRYLYWSARLKFRVKEKVFIFVLVLHEHPKHVFMKTLKNILIHYSRAILLRRIYCSWVVYQLNNAWAA